MSLPLFSSIILIFKKESCKAGFSACGGSRKRHSTIPPQCDPRGAFIIVWKRSFLYDNKECALAHSRAEARLLQQPSTLAPSAHPRGAFLSYGNEVSYTMKTPVHNRLCTGLFLTARYARPSYGPACHAFDQRISYTLRRRRFSVLPEITFTRFSFAFKSK